jgi:hypothetical protein
MKLIGATVGIAGALLASGAALACGSGSPGPQADVVNRDLVQHMAQTPPPSNAGDNRAVQFGREVVNNLAGFFNGFLIGTADPTTAAGVGVQAERASVPRDDVTRGTSGFGRNRDALRNAMRDIDNPHGTGTPPPSAAPPGAGSR